MFQLGFCTFFRTNLVNKNVFKRMISRYSVEQLCSKLTVYTEFKIDFIEQLQSNLVT